MRSGALFVVLGAMLAVGAAGWLLWTGGAGGGAEEGGSGRDEGEVREGPVLAGHGSAPALARGAELDGEFDIVGRVEDPDGRPAAGVPVTARRTGDVPDGARRARVDTQRAERAVNFAPPRQAWKDAPPDASGVSGADGSFTLRVRRRGDYSVRAEPAAPLVGTREAWRLDRTPPREALRLEVLRGSGLRGRVVSSGDRGLDAFVRVVRDEDGWESPWAATAAGTGRFELDAVPDGAMEVEVLVPGKTRLRGWPVKAPTADEVVIHLGGSARLATGSVRDLAGRPIAGAHVGVTVEATLRAGSGGMPLDARLLAVSDDAGAFTLEGAVAGRVTEVEADADGYLFQEESPPLARWSGLVLDPARVGTLAVVLWKGGVLEGRVVAHGSGAPLAGAVVRVGAVAVDARMTSPPLAQATSDAAGRYVVEGLPVGQSMVSVEHPTHFFAPLEAWRGSGRRSSGAETPPPSGLTVFVAEEGQRIARDLELAPGIPVTGRVVDGRGEPVDGAEVFVERFGTDHSTWAWGLMSRRFMSSSSGSAESKAVATSGPDGTFTVKGLPPREEWVLHARKSPLLGERSMPFPLSAGAERPDVVLRLVEGVTVAGQVVDAQGTPVAEAKVQAYLIHDGGEGSFTGGDPYPTATTDAQGAFRLQGLLPGRLNVNARAKDLGSATQEVEPRSPGDVRTGLELRLEREESNADAATLSGFLVDEAGAPVRGRDLQFSLVAHDMFSSTGTRSSPRDGSFEVQLGTGKVSIGNGEMTLLEVEAPATNVRVVWKEGAKRLLEGLVVDAEGRPVPLCVVGARGTSGPQDEDAVNWPADDQQTAVNGWFRREVVDRAPFSIVVSRPRDAEGRPLNLQGRTLTLTDAPSGPLTITLEPGGTVSGRVVGPDGKGVPGIAVSSGSIAVLTDEAGAFVLGGFGSGPVALTVAPPSPWTRPSQREVTPGGPPEVITLTEGLTVAGQVRGGAGVSVVGMGSVDGTWAGGAGGPGGSASGPITRDGRFRLVGIPPDALVTLRVNLWRWHGSQAYAARTVANVAAGRQDVVIDLTQGAALSGTVEESDGRPFTSGTVGLTCGGDESETAYARIDDRGAFRVLGLPPGKVTVTVWRHDGGPAPKPVEVQAPTTGVRIVLPVLVPIQGRLVGVGDRASSFRVWAWPVWDRKTHDEEKEGGDREEETRAVPVAKDGTFSINVVGSEGRWMLAASAKDDERYALAGPVEAGREGLTLTAVKGAAIEGSVATADGGPLPRPLFLTAIGDHWRVESRPDVEGRFVLRGLPPGAYSLNAYTWADGYESVTVGDVEAGRRDLRLVMKREVPGALPPAPAPAACGAGGLACGK